jgi:hypothetical protein
MFLLAGTPALTRAHRAGENGPFKGYFFRSEMSTNMGVKEV